MLDLRSTQDYLSWRSITASDTPLTVYKPSDIATLESVANKVQGVTPSTFLDIMAYGKNAAAKTGTIKISGWMGQPGDRLKGPGQVLWSGNVVLGAITFSEPILPDKWWGSAGAWFQVNTFTPTVDLGGAIVLASGDQAHLLVPTLAFTRLALEMTLGTMTELGVVSRKVGFDESIV